MRKTTTSLLSRKWGRARSPSNAMLTLPLSWCILLFWGLSGPVAGPPECHANGPGKAGRSEQTGAVTVSIHVPPVRSTAPSKSIAIERPAQYQQGVALKKQTLSYKMESLRLAIEDLQATFGAAYPKGDRYLDRWQQLSAAIATGKPNLASQVDELRGEALLANPLLKVDRLIALKRKKGQLALPTNHQCNTCLKQRGYDNELVMLTPVRPGGRLTTLFRPPDGLYVGEMDLHFNADRLLFTMPNGRTWQIHEIGIDGSGLRQVTREVADVDYFDPCYLPSGKIVFGSTASFTGVPCWHGQQRACCLYVMDADGTNTRQLCFDQDLDLHPSVLDNGQVIYSRWDYTGLLHAYVRPLMVMNPDGSGQRAVYGSNSYYPNSLFFPRSVPGHPTKIAAILAGYHGLNRMGELAILDIAVGWKGQDGVMHRITHRGEPVVPVAIDPLTQGASLQFLHPLPLSDKYLLTAMQPGRGKPWGIYLVDVFDNIVPILVEPGYDFFEPLLVQQRPVPLDLPDRTDPTSDQAVIVLHDIYRGDGLRGVPRGTIKRLRIAAYHFGFPGMAGPDKIGRAGPWEAMRILGTVPVNADGSAKFYVPANTPITLQALDAEGKAVQLMRSWYTAMPGELASCVGCHESPRETPLARHDLAAERPVSEIEPWYGPARGFDFAREVQPVLDRYCVICHDGKTVGGEMTQIDLRPGDSRLDYAGLPLTKLGATRIDPSLTKAFPDRFRTCGAMPPPYGNLNTHYTPAYEALIPFIRRPNVEDGVQLLRPGEYHADTSELIQMLAKGHHGVELSDEAWDRLVTWIDLNGPCHGTWGDVAPIPGHADQRRLELARAFGGPKDDPEAIAPALHRDYGPAVRPVNPTPSCEQRRQTAAGLLETVGARSAIRQPASCRSMTVDLGGDQSLELVEIPAGRFVMGDLRGDGDANEFPNAVVTVEQPFWMARTEVSNAQFRCLFPDHASGFFTKRQIDPNGPGIQLDDPLQPVVRVSWMEANAFCERLSKRTGYVVSLPTEGQWEYAARAGSTTEFSFGTREADFSPWANMADRSLTCLYSSTAGVTVLQPIPAALDRDDQAIGTARTAAYQANAWGLFDMHGNAAEWTRSAYRPYPYDAKDGRNEMGLDATEKRVVRGGSFFDRPKHCRSACRQAYPPWQPVHDVGFRVVIEGN